MGQMAGTVTRNSVTVLRVPPGAFDPRGALGWRAAVGTAVASSPGMTKKCVTVRKTGRKYECFAPGETIPFATRTTAGEACAVAWTFARYKLKNDAIGYSGSVIPEGFKLPK